MIKRKWKNLIVWRFILVGREVNHNNIKTQRRQTNEEEPRKKRNKKRREKQKMNESAQMMGYKSYRDMERDNNG